VLSQGLPSTAIQITGEQMAARALGWSCSVIPFDPSNPATLQAALLTALAKHPTAVTLTGVPQSEFGASTIAAYAAAKVPIILGADFPISYSNTILGDPSGAASETAAAKVLAAWFVADSDGQGKALFENATSFPILKVFVDAFETQVATMCAACKVKIVPVTAADISSNGVIPKVVAAARSNPDYKYIFFDNGSFGDGIVSALNAAGLSNMRIGGRSIDSVGAAALKAGTEQAWTGESYYLLGESLVDLAARHIEGAGGTSDDDVIPVQLLTKNNINNVVGNFNAPTDSLAQFESLWHVSGS
jgi:ribose transport system substrate-binding protein